MNANDICIMVFRENDNSLNSPILDVISRPPPLETLTISVIISIQNVHHTFFTIRYNAKKF